MRKITIKNVSKTLKKKVVLNNVNLVFEAGNIYGLVGRNGSGKTMLLRAICGLIFPDEGAIYIDDKKLHRDISFPESCGTIIENTELLPNFSAFDNLKILSQIKNTASDEKIKNTICIVGLDPESKMKVKAFSLGMKQRLSLVQALFEDPELLLLDEPTNALDEEGVICIRKILQEEKVKGKIVIIASHNKEDIYSLADKIITVESGNFIAE
ncbi:MAG: ABC transporter ATP-binding protein [Ruminococcus sp.]|nr:ABC transporter ATP-binding protein [Ruminococcus sp.]